MTGTTSNRMSTCRIICWIVAIAGGLIAANIAYKSFGASGIVSIIMGLIAALVLSFLLRKIFCTGDTNAVGKAAAVGAGAMAAGAATASRAASSTADAAGSAASSAASAATGAASAGADTAMKAVSETASTAKTAAKSTAAKTKTAAKSTATKAKTAAKSTTSKAKTAAKSTAAKTKTAAKSTASKTKTAAKSTATKAKSGASKTAAKAKTTAAKAVSKPAAKKAPAKKAPAKPKLYTSRPSKVDDLKLISGVGPKLENTLHDVGVYQFAQVASWKKADISYVDDRLKFKGRIERDEWVKQAKILAKGGETEFSKRSKKG